MATVLRDKPFYDRSGGGLTLSGGEPFMQPEMATALLQASHEAGIHTAVETCLHVPWKYIAPSLSYIDLFLADLKHVADAPFKQWTDGNAARVLDNLKKLAAAGKKIIIRVPLILPPTSCTLAKFISCPTTRWASTNITYLICPMTPRKNRLMRQNCSTLPSSMPARKG